MDDLKERLLYTHEHGLFDANLAGMLASPKEAADRIEALEAELAARDGEIVAFIRGWNGATDDASTDLLATAIEAREYAAAKGEG